MWPLLCHSSGPLGVPVPLPCVAHGHFQLSLPRLLRLLCLLVQVFELIKTSTQWQIPANVNSIIEILLAIGSHRGRYSPDGCSITQAGRRCPQVDVIKPPPLPQHLHNSQWEMSHCRSKIEPSRGGLYPFSLLKLC